MTKTVLSSKGQVVIPEYIRKDLGWKRGVKLDVIETPTGVFLVRIPTKPLSALKGLGRHLTLSSQDVRRLRQQDEKYDREEHSS